MSKYHGKPQDQDQRCPSCGGLLNEGKKASKFSKQVTCAACAKVYTNGNTTIKVRGTVPHEVEKVSSSLIGKIIFSGKMEELLSKLFSGEGKLNLLMLQAKEFAERYLDEHFINFLSSELNGYTVDLGDLPEYRKIVSQIVITVNDHFGRITHSEYPLDVSAISKKLNFDLSTCFIPDGIPFIEDNLTTITGSSVIKPLLPPLVEMLNEVFIPSNPGLKIRNAGHRIDKASLQFIITKVRQEVIIGLQKLKKQKEPLLKSTDKSSKVENTDTKVFVTYAWESESENDKIISFVNFLRESGFDASMDKKESQESTSTNFNHLMVTNLQKSDKVIIVLSEKYKDKADNFQGGVGMEFSMIIDDLKTNKNKYIFVTFGNKKFGEVTPFAIAGTDILDLKKDQDDHEFNNLFSRLNSVNIITFSPVSEEKVQVKPKEIKPFKL